MNDLVVDVLRQAVMVQETRIIEASFTPSKCLAMKAFSWLPQNKQLNHIYFLMFQATPMPHAT